MEHWPAAQYAARRKASFGVGPCRMFWTWWVEPDGVTCTTTVLRGGLARVAHRVSGTFCGRAAGAVTAGGDAVAVVDAVAVLVSSLLCPESDVSGLSTENATFAPGEVTSVRPWRRSRACPPR